MNTPVMELYARLTFALIVCASLKTNSGNTFLDYML